MEERQKRYYYKYKGANYRLSVGFDTATDEELIRFLRTEAKPYAGAYIAEATRQRYRREKKRLEKKKTEGDSK